MAERAHLVDAAVGLAEGDVGGVQARPSRVKFGERSSLDRRSISHFS